MEDDGSVSLSSLSKQELAARITELAGHLNAATHRWLVLLAEFDRRHGWSDGFTKSCAHWLNWQCGIDLGAAREKVRVARALEDLPKISAAMASGGLSYSKVRELTRIATDANEKELLEIAGGRDVFPELRNLALGTFFLLGSSAAGLLFPQAIRLIIDEALHEARLESINQLALVMAFIFFVQAGASALRYMLYHTAGERVVIRLREQLYRRLMEMKDAAGG